MHALEHLFNPKSIAVIGASLDEYKAGYQVVFSLKDFPGRLYPVNPKVDSILGFKTYPNITAIPEKIDLALLTIPAAACPDAVEEAGRAGAASVMIISGGFAESGEAGKQLQERLMAACRTYGMRLLGPNTAGYANFHAAVSANFTPWIMEIKRGGIGLISQSGAMTFTISSLLHARKLGLSIATGTGNGADVDPADALDYLAQHSGTKVILLYFEGIANGRRLYEVVRKAAKQKPVVILTVGKGNVAEFAASHTGNLMGSYALKCAALSQAGAVVVETVDELIDAAAVFSQIRLEPKDEPGVGLLTGQAGPSMIMTDYLRSRGVVLPELGKTTVEKIRKLLPMSYIKNPVDTTRPGPSFPEVFQAMADDPVIDMLMIFAIHEPAVIDPVSLFERVKGKTRKPVLFVTAGFPDAVAGTVEAVEKMGVPAFTSPNSAARAAAALVHDAKAACSHPGEAVDLFKEEPPFENKTFNEGEAKDILDRIGIPTPTRAVCVDHEEALRAFRTLRKPCVVKVLDSAISHKTEVGGVQLNISNEDALLKALQRIDKIQKTRDNRRQYLIEEMAESGVEILLGARNDPSFGPSVMVGMGGVAAEAIGDTSIRLAPLSVGEAKAMLLELKGRRLFEGWRGSPQADVDSAAEAIVEIGQLISAHPEIREIDLNPVRVYEKGILALDALFIC
ncbi:acetyltransferase [Syntrophus gentianae]|uniref:Acetyltransferase n=1 Tax=Syntrophus gentianae TaxID=43775 RepID=A0A1H7UBU0_9BACT|nr:acetate--CoA ligase [Syntrophus gentianae]SEL94214.1 acetyltransferase [Syntrophus gentianae]